MTPEVQRLVDGALTAGAPDSADEELLALQMRYAEPPTLPPARCCFARQLAPKQKANLVARCALLGIVLYVTEDDVGAVLFVASKYAMTRQMSSADEVERFIKQAGGPGA